MTNTFRPSFAKIVSTPAIAITLAIALYLLLVYLLSLGIGFDDNLSLVIIGTLLVISLLLAYVISSLAWEYGKNHRRILIVAFTLLSAAIYFFVFNLVASFFTLCLQDLGLPCGGDFGPCPPPRPCPQTEISNVLSYLSIGLPILSLLVGIIAFVKQRKDTKNTSKKQV